MKNRKTVVVNKQKRANRLCNKNLLALLFMNNLKLLSKRCHEAFSNLKSPVFMRAFNVFGIIPIRLCQWA